MPKEKNINKTPLKRKLGTGTPVRLTTSPYFSPASTSSKASCRKSKHEEGEDLKPVVAHSTPSQVLSVKRETHLTTSPYFLRPREATPSPLTRLATSRLESDSEEEKEQARKEEKKRERKRRRLTVRGDTPDEPLPPPATPRELSEALRRIKPTLIQERIRDDPWKIVVATTLLNKTTGKAATPVFWELIELYPTPLALAQGQRPLLFYRGPLFLWVYGGGHIAAVPSLTSLLRPLGTQSVKASRLMRFSNAYAMHPPVLPGPSCVKKESRIVTGMGSESSLDSEFPVASLSQSFASTTQTSKQSGLPPLKPFLVSAQNIKQPPQSQSIPSTLLSPKEYLKTQKLSPIAHLPFTGPYAIDSFRIYSSGLPGGGAPVGDEAQLERVAHLPMVDDDDNMCTGQDDFDETPAWYDPALLHVHRSEEDDEWRKVRPNDKELKRYLVWRWAIEGLAYDPETQTFELASWNYLVNLIRK
ncbi:hypothetical protein BDV93DRAFT_562168 [Ceratobasidium sp. AG-I]|nr:hypothetical protein BDV93DRAFT_562168 [Ceratobasidium sp. AG-I]